MERELEQQKSELDSTQPISDDSDSKSWTTSLIESLPGKSKPQPSALMTVDRDADLYNMKHHERGRAIIFNNKDFLQPGLNSRNGTDADRDKLKKCALSLGFDVKVYNDATIREIHKVLSELANEDHSKRDCLLVAVFSHGDVAKIHAYDGEYKPQSLWEPFAANECPTLAGKPKIFLIQACQGDQLDGGTLLKRRTQVDGKSIPDKEYTVPNTADFLTVYSTMPGYYSWRNTTEGSWFIQSVCKILGTYSEKKDLLSMMTMVSRNVALNYESFVPDRPDMDRKKQMPLITSTLIRDIYF